MEPNDLLNSMISNVPFGIVVIDLDGNILVINQLLVYQLFMDGKPDSMLETNLTYYLNHLSKLKKKILKVETSGRRKFNLHNLKINGQFFNISGRKMLNGMIITTTDITETKEIERKVLKAMLQGQEKERQRLAKEIHDGIGPLMSTLKLNIDAIKREFDVESEPTMQKFENIEQLVKDIASDIRGISHSLMPSALKDFGLVSTIEQLCHRINATKNLKVEFIFSGIKQRLNQGVELSLYRITQELINNAIKYAQAKTIVIQIIKHQQQITLTVEDDGVGFDKDQMTSFLQTGIGLQNIQTRVQLLKGIFTLDTYPGKGVIALIEIPYFQK